MFKLEKCKTVYGIILGLFFAISLFIIKDYIRIRSEKLLIMKNDLTGSYYNKENLKEVMKKCLNDKYTGNLEVDFDNFILTDVLNRLSELENEKYKRYNSFLSAKEMEEYTQTRKDKAEHINGKKVDSSIFYIDINHFFDGVTYKKVYSLLPEFKQCRNLIIDLRDNSGGTFDELKSVASIFLDKGKLIYQLNYGDKKESFYSNNGGPIKFDKIIILINNNTASVSELFVLALKENLSNVITIGTNSYGKNISYSFRNFRDKSAMVFITSIMEGANFKPIDINGIKPDIEIGHSEIYYNQIIDRKKQSEEREKDSELQYDKAVQYLRQK